MNIRLIQYNLLCITIGMFSLSFCMNEQREIVLWKSPISKNINGSEAYAELIKDNIINLKFMLINGEKEKYEGIVYNEPIDFIVMKKEGPGFDENGLPYMHAYGECFNNVFEATRKERKKIKQLLMVKKILSYHTQAYACTYELRPFDKDFSWSRGEMEDFYNFPVLLKAFLHSTQKRYETWLGEGCRCFYQLDGVTLPANYKKVRKNPNTHISKYTSYDMLREEVRQLIDEHYNNQKALEDKAVEMLSEQHQNQNGCILF